MYLLSFDVFLLLSDNVTKSAINLENKVNSNRSSQIPGWEQTSTNHNRLVFYWIWGQWGTMWHYVYWFLLNTDKGWSNAGGKCLSKLLLAQEPVKWGLGIPADSPRLSPNISCLISINISSRPRSNIHNRRFLLLLVSSSWGKTIISIWTLVYTFT